MGRSFGELCYLCEPARRRLDDVLACACRVLRAAREANDVAQCDDKLGARCLFEQRREERVRRLLRCNEGSRRTDPSRGPCCLDGCFRFFNVVDGCVAAFLEGERQLQTAPAAARVELYVCCFCAGEEPAVLAEALVPEAQDPGKSDEHLPALELRANVEAERGV